jgi:hypothetical protein
MRRVIGPLLLVATGCASQPWLDPGNGWRTVTSQHFVIHTDSGDRAAREVVERFEAVHAALSTFLRATNVRRVEGLLFLDETAYEGVAGRTAGAFAIFEGEADGVLVLRDDEDRDWMDFVVGHELAHRFVTARHPHLPPWLHEGLATYLETARHQGSRLLIGGLPLEILHFEFGGGVGLRRLSRAPGGSFHGASAGALYASAWAVVHYLLNGARGANHVRFRRLLAELGDSPGGPDRSLEAFTRAFPEKTFEEIDDAALAHARRMLATRSEAVITVASTPPPTPTIDTRPADPARVRDLCLGVRGAFLAKGGGD